MNRARLVATAIAGLLAACVTGICQNNPPPRTIPPAVVERQVPPRPPPAAERADTDAVNYVIRIEWKDSKNASHHVEVLTTEGTVNLDTFLPDKVKIDESEIPITLTLKGSLTVLTPERGRLTLFLGRTVPYVTGMNTGAGGRSSSYQQRQVGLSSVFVVTFGKPVVIQSDENEKVSVLVKRAED